MMKTAAQKNPPTSFSKGERQNSVAMWKLASVSRLVAAQPSGLAALPKWERPPCRDAASFCLQYARGMEAPPTLANQRMAYQ